jgi:RHS repeat-associated protein
VGKGLIVDVAGRTLARWYTLGHDVIAQSTAAGIPASADGTVFAEATTHHLLTDGHGSTRLLANLTATTVALAQQYLYNAYGEMLSAEHLATATTALTSLLYSGEWTNNNGTQYLRARSYDPATGRFNRLDPFAGNQNDPQSLHKYLYTHGNPIMGIDPSGKKVYWGARDLASNLIFVGNHHSLFIIPDKRADFKASELLSLGKGNMGFTLGAFSKDGRLQHERNNAADLRSIREYYEPELTKERFSWVPINKSVLIWSCTWSQPLME